MDPNRGANRAERGDRSTAPPGNIADPRSCCSWRRWIRPVVYVIYGLLVAAATPFVIIDFIEAEEEEKFKRTLTLVGFIAMVISIPISIWGIINHIICFTRPRLQKYIIRILWMVPIYVLCSWFALRFPQAKIYLDAIRELYQALAVYNFVFYIVAFFDEVPDFDSRLASKSEIQYPLPLCRVRAVPDKGTIRKCKKGVLNYTVIRIIVTIVTIVTHLTGNYNEGDFTVKNPYLWVCIIVIVSQIWASFCKNLLRRATLDELKLLHRSALQFLAIQLVIFVTFYQSTLFNILAKTGVLKPNPAWGFNPDDSDAKFLFATMLQDFVICLEMVAFAALFTYSFDCQRYNTNEPKLSLPRVFVQMWTVSDVKSGIEENHRSSGNNTNEGYQLDRVPATVDGVHPSAYQ